MAPNAKKQRILYWIKDLSPTEEEVRKAGAIPTVIFRTAQGFSDSNPIEKCDGCAGLVPAVYAAKFPVVDKVEIKAEQPTTPPVATAPVATPPPPPPPPLASPASGAPPTPWAK